MFFFHISSEYWRVYVPSCQKNAMPVLKFTSFSLPFGECGDPVTQ